MSELVGCSLKCVLCSCFVDVSHGNIVQPLLFMLLLDRHFTCSTTRSCLHETFDSGCRAEEQAAAKEGAQAQSAKQHADKAAKEKAALQQGLTAAQAEVSSLPWSCLAHAMHTALRPPRGQAGCTWPSTNPVV